MKPTDYHEFVFDRKDLDFSDVRFLLILYYMYLPDRHFYNFRALKSDD